MAKKTISPKVPDDKAPISPTNENLAGDAPAAETAPKDWPADMFGSEPDAFDELLEGSEEWHAAMISEGRAEYQKGQTKPLEP